MTWTAWLGWTLLFVVIYWIVQVAQGVLTDQLGEGGASDAVQMAAFLIPLAAAFLIGARLREWNWVLGPPVAIALTMLTYPVIAFLGMSPAERQQFGSGLVLAAGGILLSGIVAMLAAAAGVWFGRSR
jgi:hypothetical protein